MQEAGSPALQRAASLLHLPPLLSELGASLEEVLEGTGVTSEDLRPNVYIPYASYLDILGRAATMTGCDDIGWRLGRRQTLASLGPLGEAMRHAATLGEAIGDFTGFQISNSAGAAVYAHRISGDLFLGYGIYDPRSHFSPYVHDVVLATGCNLVAELTQGAVQPRELLSIRSLPPDLRPYQAPGNREIRFAQEQTGLFLPGECLALTLPRANPRLRRAALDTIAPQSTFAPWGMAGRVKHALRGLMLDGRTTMAAVAHHIEMHPRSLRRALRSEGTTFETIKDEVRYTVARELLTLTALPIGDIAMALGFASPSSFVHGFRRWSGTSPARWRGEQANAISNGQR